MQDMAASHILSAVDPVVLGTSISTSTNNNNHGGRTRSPGVDRNFNVTLDDRDLWLRFQNLTNEMIVTKNGSKELRAGSFPAIEDCKERQDSHYINQ